MAVREPNILRDGQTNFLGGMDSGRNPSLLNENESAFITNGTVRGGYAETRPGWPQRTLTFATAEIEEWYTSNFLQGVGFATPNVGNPLFLVAVGGRLFSIDVLNSYRVADITPTQATSTTINMVIPPVGASTTVTVTDASGILVDYPVRIGSYELTVISKVLNTLTLLNEDATAGVGLSAGSPIIYLDPGNRFRPQVWMTQAEEFTIIQDGQSKAIIFNGSMSRRAAAGEVPTGTAMAYYQDIGRLAVAVGGNQIAIGDVVGGTTSVLNFTEENLIAGGGRFRISQNYGPITAMVNVASLDSSLGKGPLQVYTQTSITTLDLPPNRLLWADLPRPQTVSLINFGATSQNSTVLVNGDVFFRSRDGLRSFVLAQRDFAGWGNTPISRELQRITRHDDPKLLPFSSAILFENRFIFTVNPMPFQSIGAYHRGLVALDFDLISTIGTKAQPVYDGLWTGLRVMQVAKGTFNGDERAFAFALDSQMKNTLWEISKADLTDHNKGRIEMVVETRSMDCGNRFELKSLDGAEIWLDRVIGTVDIELYWRADQYPCFLLWGTEQLCVRAEDCLEEDDTCKTPREFKPGYKTRLRFRKPPEYTNPFEDTPAHLVYEAQLCLIVRGHARIKRMLLKAVRVQEDEVPHA